MTFFIKNRGTKDNTSKQDRRTLLASTFRRSFLLGLSGLLAITLILPFLSLSVNAKINEATPYQEAQSTAYYRLLRDCVKNNMYNSIQLTGADSGVAVPSKWFDDNSAYGYTFPDGKTSCKDAVDPALELWGWGSDYSAFLRDMGYTYEASGPRWVGTNNGDTRQAGFDSAVQSKYYTMNFAGDPVQSGAARYEMFLNAFTKACSAVDLGPISSITNSSYRAWLDESTEDKGKEINSNTASVPGLDTGPSNDFNVYFSKVYVVGENADGEPARVEHGFAYQTAFIGGTQWYGAGSEPLDGKVEMYGYHNRAVERSCHEVQKGITENAAAWLGWVRENPEVPIDIPNTDGAVVGPVETSTCTVPGIGWIVCPVLTFTGGIVDAAYGFVANLLVVQPLMTTGANGEASATYNAWVIMRNLANIAFVIAFLIIIFSQLTSVGISNYGVKKMLPRLVVAAILVNISFWVCALAIDASNIIGSSVMTIFNSVGNSIPFEESVDSGSVLLAGGGWLDLVGTVTAATLVGGALYYVGLSALIPALIAAVVAIVTVFLVLTLRQALIILLIVVSPLAFVAYLLPNTEDLFTKWRKFFTTLLLMFPVIAGIFGASALASVIVAGSSDNVVVQIMGAAIAILPLAITPIVMKTAGGVLNRFAGIVNNTEKGPVDRLRKAGEGYRQGRLNLRNANAMSVEDGGKGSFQGGRGVVKRWQARRGAINSGRDTAAKEAQRDYVAGELGRNSNFATAVAAGDSTKGARLADKAKAAAEAEDLKEALQPLLRQLASMSPGGKSAHLDTEIAAGGSRQAAALHYAAQIGDTGFLRKQMSGMDSTGTMVSRDPQEQANIVRRAQEAINANPGGVIGKAPDLVKGTSAAFGSIKGEELVQFKPDTAKAFVSHLTTLQAKASAPGASAKEVQDFEVALNGFNSAVEDITKSPELQGKFSGEVGTAIMTELSGKSFASRAYGLAAIQPDGKIR